ncbi:MAG: nodulation protein NfeD [Methylothermaceae bacterium]|nr:nodulation protein NfeD [Methylothermaceae bacterium]
MPGKQNSVVRRWRLLRISACLFLFLTGGEGIVVGATSNGENTGEIYLVTIDSTINPGTLGLLEHAIEIAETQRAGALIVQIDTPGGLLSATRDMVGAISESDVPVIGYVAPAGASATSAGAFILLATHIAAMHTGTNVGASSPVAGDGSDVGGTLGKKIMNDTRAFMRSIAAKQGRNADVAERFVSEALSLSASEAKQQQVVDLIADSIPELLAQVEGREVRVNGKNYVLALSGMTVHPVAPRLIDRLLIHIAHPQVAHLLISLGTLGVYIEILSPGLGFPGVFGAVAVILGLVGVQTLPVNMGFLILLFLGIAFMVAEYFVAGFGVLGIGGAIAFILGSLNLFDVPSSADYQSEILSISIAVAAAILLTTWLVSRSLAGGPRARQMAGKTGEAMVSFDQRGHVLIDDERWPAETLEPLKRGDKITVVQKNADGCLTVKKS